MNLKIRDLFDISVCKNLYLLGGSSGLENGIRWFYIVENSDSMEGNVKSGDMLIIQTSTLKQDIKEIEKILTYAGELSVSGILFFECPMLYQIDIDQFCKLTDNKIPVLVNDNAVPVTDITYHIAMGIMRQSSHQYGLANLMQELLDGNLGNKLTLYSRADCFRYNLEQPHRVLIIRLCNYVYGDENIDHLASGVQRICNNYLSGFYNVFMSKSIRGDYIALLPPNSRNCPIENIARELLGKVKEEYNDFECYIAVGNSYSKPEDFHISRSDAEQILKITEFLNKKNQVVNTFHVMEYLMILNIKDKKIIENCCHIIKILEENSETDRTRLIDTLDTFFKCNCNAVLTAKKMFIHRNTLKMRIDKIEEICGVDLRNYEECFRLKMAIIVYQMKNKEII